MPSPATFEQLRVVLVATRNPLNIGAVARAMSNFGFSRLRVVNPFPAAFRDARSAVGASHVLAAAEEFPTVAEAVADCTLVVGTTAVRHRELRHSLRRLEAGGRMLRKGLASGPVALLFGSEKFGLSNDDFSHCHWLLRIPTCEANISMNLGQAVAVCLYELVRDAKVSAKEQKQPVASAAEVERVSVLLLDAMYVSGYLKRKPTRDAEARLRRLVRRLRLPASDVGAFSGIVRQIVWKLHNPGERLR